jgi:putative endonuclease
MSAERQETGRWGEAQAERFLKRKRYRILGRRVRMGRRDEIDLVARDGGALVFVEVKTRQDESFGRPMSAVDKRKRHALCRAAVRYLKEAGWPDVCFRFDVVEVIRDSEGRVPVIRHVENAFALEGRYSLPY